MRRGSFVQTVTDRGKINLRMFPTRKYENCRICRSIFWIDSHIIDQEMHTNYIRLFIYHSILGGGGYIEHKKTKFFHVVTAGKFRTSWLLLGQIICWHIEYDH